jgi:hypothetical protein
MASKHASYLHHVAQGMLPQQQLPQHAELVRMLAGVWKLPWDNNRKEFLWRLVLDGVPTAARMHMGQESCVCGAAVPDRQHHYWDCPVAVAVRAEVQRQLPVGCALQQQHLWLGRLPNPHMHKGVWLVSVLAALLAMDKGRKLLCKWRLEQAEAGQGPPMAQQIPVAANLAVATLWDMLADFVGLKLCPPKWLLEVGVSHPLLAVQQYGAADWVLRVRRV